MQTVIRNNAGIDRFQVRGQLGGDEDWGLSLIGATEKTRIRFPFTLNGI